MEKDKIKELEEYDLYSDFKERMVEEDKDAVDAVIPPSDIIAFNEQRSCADLYRMCQKGQIDLYPDFQRGEVWSNRAQTLFVDSLIKQLPIPSMCISLDIKSQKRYVIDGLQRITTIYKFLGDSDWKLAALNDVDKKLSGKRISDIRKNSPDIVDVVENLTIPVTVLRCDYSNKEHMQYLFQIFYRLNSGGNKLYNQEIRNCIFQGSFNTLLKNLARSEEWLEVNKVTKDKVDNSRFNHEERILRFFAFYFELDQYNGKLAAFLNEFMRNHKNICEDEMNMFASILKESLLLAKSIKEISTSKNVFEAVLIGIAKNKDTLQIKSEDDINALYSELLDNEIFSEESLKEGLGATEKVKNRIKTAIKIFGHD